MRRMILPLMLIVVACQPAAMELTEEQEAEIEESVIQAVKAYGEAWAAEGDIEDFMAHVSDWTVPWTGFESLDAAKQMIQSLWERDDFGSSEYEFDVRVLGPDAAAVKATRVSAVTTAGGVSQEQTEDFAGVWVREDGQWKLLVIRQYGRRTDT
jgi:hypothetical protein